MACKQPHCSDSGETGQEARFANEWEHGYHTHTPTHHVCKSGGLNCHHFDTDTAAPFMTPSQCVSS